MKYVIANWKMNVGVRESVALARSTLLGVRGRKAIPEVIVCPSFVALSEVHKILAHSVVALGAQQVSAHEAGAFTGEISGRQLKELGVQYVIVGHFDQRTKQGHTSEQIKSQIEMAISNDIVPIVCVGDSKEAFNAGESFQQIGEQLHEIMTGLSFRHGKVPMVAYEPFYAIGTGESAQVDDVVRMHTHIRLQLTALFPHLKQADWRVVYGGSLAGENAYAFLREDHIDGVLVGSASIKIQQFLDIIFAGCEVLEGQLIDD